MAVVVRASGVTKDYRRRTRRYDTLKGAAVGWLRGGFRRPPAVRHRALEDVSFQVESGTTFAVVGANGSGKSTLLKLMAGILRPSAGSIRVEGRVAALLELGAGFHPEISGRENVIINGILLGLARSDVERRLDEIVAFAGLAESIDDPVRSYSSGMYVRLGFAVATAVDPDVLLVDEVLAVGDEEFSHKCLERFRELKRRGKTIVLVTHSLDLAASLADRACWLHEGRLRAEGYPREVVDAYRELVAAREEERLQATGREQEAEESDPRAPRRWGDRKVTIEKVRLLDASGSERHVFRTGESASVELEVQALKPVTDFVFGVGIFSQEGECVYGTNTDIEGYVHHRLEGSGRVRITFPRLHLLEGRYALDVAVHRKSGAAYDYRLGALAFRMSTDRGEAGTTRLEHSWQTAGGITLERTRTE